MSDTPSEVAVTEAPPEPEMRHGVPVTFSRGQVVLHPDRAGYVALVQSLRSEGFWTCVDLCVVDYLINDHRELPVGVDPERFEVVVCLLNHRERSRIRIRVQVSANDLTIDTLVHVHPGTEAPEREAFDLFGVTFAGHPDLTRILLPDEWQGHPLRKDHPIGRIPVQFKAAPAAR